MDSRVGKLAILIALVGLLWLLYYWQTHQLNLPVTYHCNYLPTSQGFEDISNCECPQNLTKFSHNGGAYCAKNSQLPCTQKIDCPENEQCISYDLISWLCIGQPVGCYHSNFNNTEELTCVE